MARTMIARLPRLFQTRSYPIAAAIIESGIMLGDCFYSDNDVLCILLKSPRWGDSNENTQHTFMLEKLEKTITIMFPVVAL